MGIFYLRMNQGKIDIANKNDQYPIQLAAKRGYVNIVRTLLGLDSPKDGLIQDIKNKNVPENIIREFSEELLQEGSSNNNDGKPQQKKYLELKPAQNNSLKIDLNFNNENEEGGKLTMRGLVPHFPKHSKKDT